MRDIGTEHLPANERILSFLDRYSDLPNNDQQIIYAIETTRDEGGERRDEITRSDLERVLFERREAIERLVAWEEASLTGVLPSRRETLTASTGDFLATIQSDA